MAKPDRNTAIKAESLGALVLLAAALKARLGLERIARPRRPRWRQRGIEIGIHANIPTAIGGFDREQ